MSYKHEQTGSHHKIVITRQCSSCAGTGLYDGIGERDGFAVVCSQCSGTGKSIQTIEWEDFTRRIAAKGVRQVLECNPGICAGGTRDFGGMSYTDWDAGLPFPPKSEMRQFTCPAWWYQRADYSKKPEWPECMKCGSFPGCDRFPNKEQCWEKFDKESQ